MLRGGRRLRPVFLFDSQERTATDFGRYAPPAQAHPHTPSLPYKFFRGRRRKSRQIAPVSLVQRGAHQAGGSRAFATKRSKRDWPASFPMPGGLCKTGEGHRPSNPARPWPALSYVAAPDRCARMEIHRRLREMPSNARLPKRLE